MTTVWIHCVSGPNLALLHFCGLSVRRRLCPKIVVTVGGSAIVSGKWLTEQSVRLRIAPLLVTMPGATNSVLLPSRLEEIRAPLGRCARSSPLWKHLSVSNGSFPSETAGQDSPSGTRSVGRVWIRTLCTRERRYAFLIHLILRHVLRVAAGLETPASRDSFSTVSFGHPDQHCHGHSIVLLLNKLSGWWHIQTVKLRRVILGNVKPHCHGLKGLS